MRKNYFAKKLVAYSMAFAVAFSTLTVSPMFVKEAKADAGDPGTPGTVSYTLTGADNTASDGKVILNPISTQKTGNVTLTDAQLKDKLGIDATNVISKVSIADKAITGITYAKGAKIPYVASTAGFDGQSAEIQSTDEGFVFNNKKRVTSVTPGKEAEESKLGNKNVTITTGMVAASAPTSGSEVVVGEGDTAVDITTSQDIQWYKLIPATVPIEVSYVENSKEQTETVDAKYWTLTPENTFVSDDKTDLVFDEVQDSHLGLYLGVKFTNKAVKSTGRIYDTQYVDYELVNMYQASDLEVKATNSVVKGIVGGKAIIEVNATATGDNLTYSWTLGGTKLTDQKGNKIELTNLKNSDFGTYKCTVSNGIESKSVAVSLSKEAGTPSKTNMTNITTNLAVLDATSHKLIDGKLTLTSNIPTNSDYRYVWKYDDGTTGVSTFLTENDVMSYDATSNRITFTVKDTANDVSFANKTVTCYAVANEVYEKDLASFIKKVNDATVNTKYAELKGLIDAGKSLSGKALFTETFNLLDNVDTMLYTNEVKVIKVGDSFEIKAPVVPGTTDSSVLKLNNGATPLVNETDDTVKSYKVNTASYSDFGEYVWTVTNNDSNEIKAIHTVNVLYVSDLAVAASDVTSKLNVENLELKVNATSSLPNITYKWNYWAQNSDKKLGAVKSTDNSYTGVIFTDGVAKIATLTDKFIYVSEEKDTDGKTVKVAEANYFTCEVSDGIATRVVTIKIDKIVPFVVYGTDGKELTDLTNEFKLNAIKDRTYTFAPKVDISEGEEVTYTWTKVGSSAVLSTDASYSIKYVESASDVKYQCVIADKNNTKFTKTVIYTVSKMNTSSVGEATDDYKVTTKNLVYTGEGLEGVVSVEHLTGAAPSQTPDFTLVKDVDYTVTYEENINVGVARATINFIGEFEKVTETKGKLTATFLIDRADNELKVEDKTVVLGGSVQPKTTNKAGAPVAYVYYADADCTTGIAVPTKVGTYYVKATSIATTNYNEATSNVATVKVVPGKVKMLGTSRTASSVKLNWNKATGATSYRVYYKAAGAKSYKVFKNTTATSMNVTGLASATTYTFAVKAYAKTAGYSTVYATKQTTTAPAKVATPSVTAGSKKATVKFTKVARATGYQIYMAKGNGSYVKVKTTTSTSFTKTGLAKGATYKFKVRAYKTVGSNTYYGAFSSAKAVVVK